MKVNTYGGAGQETDYYENAVTFSGKCHEQSKNCLRTWDKRYVSFDCKPTQIN